MTTDVTAETLRTQLEGARGIARDRETTITRAHEYLARLLKSLTPAAEPLEDLVGLCTQVDSAITGLRIQRDQVQYQLDCMDRGFREVRKARS